MEVTTNIVHTGTCGGDIILIITMLQSNSFIMNMPLHDLSLDQHDIDKKAKERGMAISNVNEIFFGVFHTLFG